MNDEPRTEVVDREDGGGAAIQPFQRSVAMAKGETSTGALAEQARAQVEARFIMAAHRPRDIDKVRVSLLKECSRSGFAETARYRRPAGRKKNEQTGRWEDVYIEGPSIRFAEAALRHMGNVDIQSPTIYEDDEKLQARVLVTDLETNTTYSRDVVIRKTTEKKSLREKQKPIDIRVNSHGDTVYIVPATDSEVEMKLGAAVSKSIRTLGLRIVPGDVIEECMETCVTVRDAKIKKDPDGERKRMIDGFAAIGVMPDALKAYVGQELPTLSPAQIGELRDLYLAIKDGITTWADVQRARNEDEEPKAGEGRSAMDELREKTRTHAEEVKAKKDAEEAAKKAAAAPAGQPQAGGEQQGEGGAAPASQANPRPMREPGDDGPDEGDRGPEGTLPGMGGGGNAQRPRGRGR